MPRTARCLGGLGTTAISLLLTGPTLAAGALEGPTTTQPTNWTAIVMFFASVLFTLAITKMGGLEDQVGGRLLCRRRRDHRFPEQLGDRRRLHVGGLLPGHLRLGVRLGL